MANSTEPFEDEFTRVLGLTSGRENIQHTRTLGQRSYLWEGDNKIVITSTPIPQPLMARNNQILGWHDVVNIYPEKFSLSLSRDVVSDHGLWDRLIALMKTGHGNVITSYSTTAEFVNLVNELVGAGLNLSRGEDTNDTQLIYFLDSKAGFRRVADKLKINNPELKIPEGYTCTSRIEALGIAGWYFSRGRSFVIKDNKGASGWGTIIIKRHQYKTKSEMSKHLEAVFAADNIWDEGPFVVEEYIEHDQMIAGGCPSTEVYIDNQGPRITYFCEQVVSNSGEFLGVGVGNEAVPEWLREKIAPAVTVIAREYYRLGYRGFFDVDMVVGSNGIPYSLETNIRRTGGTHVYDLGRTIWGEDQSSWGFLLSEDLFFYGQETMDPEVILAKANRFLFPIKSSGEGVVISMIDPVTPSLGYVIVAKTKERALVLQREFKRLWATF